MGSCVFRGVSLDLIYPRYTKALDNIKLLRKERTAELKVDKERLKFLKQDKDKAERVRPEISTTRSLGELTWIAVLTNII